jgi:hypothetical protein
LFVAAALRDAIPLPEDPGHLPVRIGINLGPVRLVKDINGQLNIIGDGINVAQRVMSFSSPGQILASRSYYEVVSRLSEDYAPLFSYEGSRTDKHVREHEVYGVGAPGPNLRPIPAPAATAAIAAAPPPRNRRLLLAVTLTFAAIVGAGAIIRMLAQPAAPPVAAVTASAPKPAATPSAGNIPLDPAKRPAETRPEGKAAPKSQGSSTRPARAVVNLAIQPWGEVFVDGKSRGVSPPLKTLEVDAGPHVIEVRNTTFPNHVANLTVKPGDNVRVQHKFQ